MHLPISLISLHDHEPTKSNRIESNRGAARTAQQRLPAMASLTLPPAPPNPRQDAIDLHKAFKGPLRHYFPHLGFSPKFPSAPPQVVGVHPAASLFDFRIRSDIVPNEHEIMIWLWGAETIVAIWLPGMRVWGCVEERSWAKLD